MWISSYLGAYVVGEQMLTKTEAGKSFGRLVRKNFPKEHQEENKGRSTGIIQGAKKCHGFKETEIYHSKKQHPQCPCYSILISANSPCFKSFFFHLLILERKRE